MSLLFCILLSCSFPLVSYASGAVQYGDHKIYVDDRFTEENAEYYMYWYTAGRENLYTCSYCDWNSDVLDSCVYSTDDNGIHTFVFPEGSYMTIHSWYGTYSYDERLYTVDKIVFDESNTTITFYDPTAGDSSTLLTPVEFYSNILDFFVSPSMDVDVFFKPSLNGPVDRSGVDSEGNEYLTQYLSMRVDNNSKFPIQYRMAIYELHDAESTDYTERPNTYDSSASHEQYSTRYDNDPVFVYYSNDWVYTDVPLAADSHNDLQNLYLKPTDLHYVAAGDSDSVTFSWSQINLHEGVNYRVIVTAVRNDYDHASMNYSDIFEEDVDSGVYQIDSSLSDKVYESFFVMLQYNDVKYDYSNSSNGILPYNGANGIDDAKRYQYSYDAVTDPRSGATDYKSVNLYDDSSSWLNQPFSHGSSSYLDTDSSNGKYNSLVAETSSVLKFFNAVFGFLPSEISSIYALGFWSLVILAIVRRIH